jgi:hypothetical protein
VRAGLQLAEAVAGLDTPAEARLRLRVGIATGLVVVGDLIGQGAAQEQGVVGETPNLAARLQALAEPGAVVIAPSTRQLTGGLFDYEHAAGFRREDTADERLDKLEAVLRQAASDLGEAAPLIAALLSLPTSERYPPLDLPPQKQKGKTLQALAAQVDGLAARQPVLMLVEDAHWSDPTSLDLLDLIIDRVSALRILLIITYRPEFSPPWAGRPQVTSLGLNRLAPRQRAEMITGVTGGGALPKEITDQIFDRTDGEWSIEENSTASIVKPGPHRPAPPLTRLGYCQTGHSPKADRRRCWTTAVTLEDAPPVPRSYSATEAGAENCRRRIRINVYTVSGR